MGGVSKSEGIADRASERCEAWKEMGGEMGLKREGDTKKSCIRFNVTFLSNNRYKKKLWPRQSQSSGDTERKRQQSVFQQLMFHRGV